MQADGAFHPVHRPFVHLHLHSNYSFCRGGNTQAEYCAALAEQGQHAFAFTEINGLHGLVWAKQAADAAGLRMITGAELTAVAPERDRAVLLVKSRQGYENLSVLISRRLALDEPGDDGRPLPAAEVQGFLPKTLRAHRDGLVVLTDSEQLLRALRRDGDDDLYVLCVPGPDRRRMLALARQLQLPPVASNDVYFIKPYDYRTHRILRAIDNNVALSRIPQEELARRDGWLKTPAHMLAAFPDAPEALENTLRIAELCDWVPEKPGDIFPNFPVPEGKTEAEQLQTLCLQGIDWRYGPGSANPCGLTPEIQKRLDKELHIINMKGFASYFLVMHDIVRHASRTCGRGSAAASLVSYLLGITHVDPIRYNLYFERFLHLERTDPPDIDVDFAWDERDDILDDIFEKYGTRHTAMISNHVTFQGRAAMREIAKVYGLADAEISRVSKRLVGFSIREIAKTVQHHPMFRNVELYDPWPEIIRLAERINGFPRNLSVHCGGVVITPQPVNRYIPVLKAAKGVQIVQVEKDQAEELGLVKLDVLGNRSLAVIRDAVAAIHRNTGEKLDFNRVNPADDPDTQRHIATGDTVGVFYVESPAMRLLQQKTRKGDFEHLVIHSSIIRPAANAYNREYIRRVRGGSWEALHPLMENILQESYGILCYQEDISRVAIAMAGFTVAQGEGLRKVFSKKNSAHLLIQHRERFFAGARKRGIAEDVISKVWGMILSFSGYSFCKPHSASYALVSYQSAYLRAHHPAEFMAAVISNQGGFYSTFAYLSEAKRMKLRVLPVDINASRREYTGLGRDLRVGFMQLKGFNSGAIDRILEERDKNGPFGSFQEFLDRTALPPSAVEILIKAGAFDPLETITARPALLWNVTRQKGLSSSLRTRSHPFQASLFDSPEGGAARVLTATRTAPPPKLRPFNLHAVLCQEAETLGFLLSRHPLTLYRHALRRYRTVPAKDLRNHIGKRIKTIGWYVTGKLVRTKNDEAMEFMSFEDTTALYETVFFPRAYEKYCHLFTHARPLILTGRVEQEFGAVTMTVEHVERVEEESEDRGSG